MPGKIRELIDHIIAIRSRGNEIIAVTTRTKIILKGIDINKYGQHSPDDDVVIKKLQKIAQELDVTL